MLGKLLKYELKATGRILLPIYAIVMILAVAVRILAIDAVVFLENSNAGIMREIFVVLLIFTFAVAMGALVIGTFVIMIQRFYKNLLGDEGYLMNTLPVSVSQNISSKLITSMIWNILSGIIAFIAILILVMNKEFLGYFNEFIIELAQIWHKVPTDLKGSGLFFVISFTIAGFLQTMFNILIIYLAMSIGHINNSHKKAISFFTWIGINWGVGIVSSAVMNIFIPHLNNLDFSAMQPVETFNFYNTISVIALVVNAVFVVGAFFATKLIMERKLNLE